MTTSNIGMTEVDASGMAPLECELADSNPDVESAVIHRLVQQAYARLTPAKVTLYLPILVSREVQDGLRARPAAW